MDNSRKILDLSFKRLALASLALMCAAVAVFTVPIIVKGAEAFAFTATSEHEKFLAEYLGRELDERAKERIADTDTHKAEVFGLMRSYETVECAAAQKAVSNAVSDAFAKFAALKGDFIKAEELAPSECKTVLESLSQKAWSGFAETLERSAQEAAKSGSISFEKFLTEQKSGIETKAKEFVGELQKQKRLGFGAKSAVRRAVCAPAAAALDAQSEKFAEINANYFALKSGMTKLLGPTDAKQKASEKLLRNKYGQTRYYMAEKVFRDWVENIRICVKDKNGTPTFARAKSADVFAGTDAEKIIAKIKNDFDKLVAPHFVFYWGFFTDDPLDSNIFGGIFPMIAGTFYLTIGAMLIAAPLGIIAAIYFSEYAKENAATSVLRMCVGTLAGVPSIVFGLFGLAFIINTLKVSDGKSVLAGAITLALLILPTIIQSCVESLKCVPNTYREAALGLGAGKWRAICTVILPAALPSMLTGIIISMGRAAGETAPIIFTAATSTGAALGLASVFTEPTPALPWNIYNICSEHEAAEMVEHVQYGMVFALMAIVLSLNLAAIILRAKLQRK